jgi:hypothetical protein
MKTAHVGGSNLCNPWNVTYDQGPQHVQDCKRFEVGPGSRGDRQILSLAIMFYWNWPPLVANLVPSCFMLVRTA